MPVYNVKPQLEGQGGGEGSSIFTVTLTKGENQWLEQDKTNEEIVEALGKGLVYFIFYREGGMYLNGFVIGGPVGNTFYLLTDESHGTHIGYTEGHFYLVGNSPN